tara:strand:+ start:314 stop:538 length:225 start_codon:yes stop_codon:yes gene_type:complete
MRPTDDVSMEELYFMEDFKSINEAWFREADDEADEMFLAYECGPETWRIDKNGIRWVYFHENIWVSELGGYEEW